MLTSLICALLLAFAAPTPQAPVPAKATGTALDRYVAAPDPSFEWKVTAALPAEGATVTLLKLTSQRWLTEREVDQPLWTHWLTVIRPARVKTDIALLYLGGGEKKDAPPSVTDANPSGAVRDPQINFAIGCRVARSDTGPA